MNIQESVDYAKKFLEDIITFFGGNLDVDAAADDEVIELSVPSSELNSVLIGRNAETLRNLQFVLSASLRNKDAELTRVNVDIADYKKQRAEKLGEKARGWIEEVRATGEPYEAHINAADRRIVHHVASEYSDISTHSEGEGRDRRLIIEKSV